MTVEEIIAKARNDISEQSPQGRFSHTYLLDKLNEVLADRVIPDLYSIGGYGFLSSFVITGSIALSASSKNSEWMEGNLATWVDGAAVPYVFYPLNPFAMVDGDEYRIPIGWVPFLAGYFMNYNLGYHKEIELGTRIGNTVYIYSNKYTTLYLEAIQIKSYVVGDEVELDDYIATKTLVPAICSEAMIKDKGINMMNIFDAKYGKNLYRLERDVVKSGMNTEVVPRTRRRSFYGLKGG